MRRLKTNLIAVGMFSTAILATIVAFLSTTLYSTVDGHVGNFGVQVTSDQTAVEGKDFYSQLAEFARNNDFEVAINYSSIAVSNGEYRIYSSALPPGSDRSERPRFERGKADIVYPLEDFPQLDPRQIIFLKGTAADKQLLSHWLESQGLEVTPQNNLLITIFSSSTIPILLTLSTLLCIVLGAGHPLSRSREIGVHRLLGLSVFETIRVETKRQLNSFVTAYLLIPLIVAGTLYAYNNWALASMFWSSYFIISAVLSLSLLSGYLCGQLMVRLNSIPQAIKGRIHARPILYSLALVRCVTLITALSAVATLVGFTAELSERQRLQEVWTEHRGPQEFALKTTQAPKPQSPSVLLTKQGTCSW